MIFFIWQFPRVIMQKYSGGMRLCKIRFVCLFDVYIAAVSVFGGRNRRQGTARLYYIMLYTSPWSRFELTTSVVIGTDCICSFKSNYHTITATTLPRKIRDLLFMPWTNWKRDQIFVNCTSSQRNESVIEFEDFQLCPGENKFPFYETIWWSEFFTEHIHGQIMSEWYVA